jgi:phage-related protein
MGQTPVKPLEWVASSKKDLLSMPTNVVDTFGYALHLAQNGGKHAQAKPLKGFGSAGVLEAVYTVRFSNAIYVLHCFQKKSHKGIATPKQDLDLIRDRLKLAQKHSEGVNK